MSLFEEVGKRKVDLPKKGSVFKTFKQNKYNFYQILGIIIFIGALVLGIVFGNMFSTCKTASYFYSKSCGVKEFNFSLMMVIWFVGLLISTLLYAIGHIICLLTKINQKLNKINL